MNGRKNLTIGKVRQMVSEMDPNLGIEDETYKAAVILLYGSLSGKHHSKTLFVRTGYDMEFIKKVTGNLRANDIWLKDGTTAADWSNEDHGMSEFWIHVAVALGLMEREK